MDRIEERIVALVAFAIIVPVWAGLLLGDSLGPWDRLIAAAGAGVWGYHFAVTAVTGKLPAWR